jgi:phenylacetate-CoA ligase
MNFVSKIGSFTKELPSPVTHLIRRAYAVIPMEKRLGEHFTKTRQFLHGADFWDEAKITNFQLQRLKELVTFAAENVPFYEDLYRRQGVEVAEIRALEDVKLLPSISKEDVRDNLEQFVARGVNKNALEYVTTGGSTALPVGFYLESPKSNAIEWAFICNAWSRAGYQPGVRTVVFRGGFVGSDQKHRYWSLDPLRKELHFSSYHLTAELIPVFLKRARDFHPEFIQAYPSAITIIAKYLKEHGLNATEFFPEVKGILCGSESVYPAQRALLEGVFQCRVFSWYGHAERVILAPECEISSRYHIYPQYGLTEVIAPDGKEAEAGELGELVGTGFNNFACPLIRYRTRDLAVPSGDSCKCGRKHRLLERVDGRLQELAVTAGGRLISMTAINMHNDVFDDVKQFQFLQRKQGEIELQLVPNDRFNTSSSAKIRRVIQEKLGGDMTLGLRIVQQIPATKSGKSRFLIQELPIDHFDGVTR